MKANSTKESIPSINGDVKCRLLVVCCSLTGFGIGTICALTGSVRKVAVVMMDAGCGSSGICSISGSVISSNGSGSTSSNPCIAIGFYIKKGRW